MARVLVIDDNATVCRTLVKMVEAMGHQAAYALTLGQGIDLAVSTPFDLVFLDVMLPDGDGLSAIADLKRAPATPEVIIFTGEGTENGAALAIRAGAWDYLQKPLSNHSVRLALKRVFQHRSEKIAGSGITSLKRETIVGDSVEIQKCLDLVAEAAQNEAPVLVTGETGTGKELFSRSIHANSARADNAFVVVDCAALPEHLIESVLFGHEKGAFTGAEKSREGLVRQADRGTLFLDEVGELSLGHQKRFLRVLQERRFRPVGSRHEVTSNFRLIAATNRDLDTMAEAGAFRKDLLFRLRCIEMHIPPLRYRKDDIKTLAWWSLARFCERYDIDNIGFFPEFLSALTDYEWPGNVRELLAAVEAAVANAGGDHILHPIHLPLHIRVKLAQAGIEKRVAPGDAATGNSGSGAFPSFSERMAFAEKKYLQDLSAATTGDISLMCSLSGISRAQLYRLLKKHSIARPGISRTGASQNEQDASQK